MFDIGEVVKSVALSMTAIIVFAVVGAVLGRFNVVDAHTDATLGRVVFLLALPALLFLEVSEQQKFTPLILVATLVTLLVGLVVGGIACQRAPVPMRRTLMMSVAVPNMASIPLALVSRLFGSGDAGILRTIVGAADALANVAISLVVLEALIWGFLFSFLAKNDPLSGLVAAPPHASDDGFASACSSDDENSNAAAAGAIPMLAVEDSSPVRLESAPSSRVLQLALAPPQAGIRHRVAHLARRAKPTVKRVFNPPFIAVILALIVANTPARDWFHAHLLPMMPAEPPPLAFVVAILRPMANCTVPLLLLVVGLSFAKLKTVLPHADDALDWLSLVLVCVCRLVIVPAIILGLMEAARGLFNPAERIVILTQACTPINIDVLIIAQLVKNNVKETTVLMFWTYVLGIVTMTGWLIAFIQLHSESEP
jgi:predicted permease